MQKMSLRIVGRVQGVGFRWFVHREARMLDVTGYVRNQSDGSVEVVAEGPEGDLRRLAAACRKGPASSDVQNVEARMEPAERRSCNGFEIR